MYSHASVCVIFSHCTLADWCAMNGPQMCRGSLGEGYFNISRHIGNCLVNCKKLMVCPGVLTQERLKITAVGNGCVFLSGYSCPKSISDKLSGDTGRFSNG